MLCTVAQIALSSISIPRYADRKICLQNIYVLTVLVLNVIYTVSNELVITNGKYVVFPPGDVKITNLVIFTPS